MSFFRRLCIISGVTRRHDQYSLPIIGQVKSLFQFIVSEQVHPAGCSSKAPRLKHHGCGHNAYVLFARMDSRLLMSRLKPEFFHDLLSFGFFILIL